MPLATYRKATCNVRQGSTDQIDGATIDPFGADPSLVSRIEGLGGTSLPLDVAYTFRTADLEFAPGTTDLTLQLANLQISGGRMLLEITNRSRVPGSPHMRLSLTVVGLDALAISGGEYRFQIEVRPNTFYSIAGFIHDDVSVNASDLLLLSDRPVKAHLDQPSSAVDSAIDGARARAADEAPEQFTNVQRMVDAGWPIFGTPHSQPWLPGQEQEADFIACCIDLNLPANSAGPIVWTEAFILQAFKKYGVLRAGAKGLGFDAEHHHLWPTLARQACSVLLTRSVDMVEFDVGETLERLRPTDFPAKKFFKHVDFSALHTISLPASYVGSFDFAWWISPADGTVKSVRSGIDRLLASLSRGALGVAVIPLDSLTSTKKSDQPARMDIECLALESIAQGYEIAQIRIPTAQGLLGLPSTIPFAFIFRRPS
jgi:hypothetical protein